MVVPALAVDKFDSSAVRYTPQEDPDKAFIGSEEWWKKQSEKEGGSPRLNKWCPSLYK